MEIDDKELFRFMQDVRGDLGEIKASCKNNAEHTTAVSHKADLIREELMTHKGDGEAHGLGAANRATGSITGWIALALTVVGLIAGWLKMSVEGREHEKDLRDDIADVAVRRPVDGAIGSGAPSHSIWHRK